MKWRGPVLDAMAAAVATVVTLAILGEGGLGTADQGYHVLDEAGLLLAVLTGLPLVVARRWPAAVFAVVAVASIALLHMGYPLDIPLGPLYAAYVLVLKWGGAGKVRRTVAAVAVVAYVPAIMVTLELRGVNVWAVFTELATWELAITGLWFAAERTRLRQAALDAAEERAQRSEREAERENRLAAAEERTRIARELHDSAGHAINVILVQAGAARLLHARDPGAALRAIGTVEEVARATIVDIDRMVHALRTEDVEPVPADPAALRELLEHHRRSGLRLETTFGGEQRPLPRSVAWAAYRILQEALTNAMRHGNGSAEVEVQFGAHAMEIAVSNRTATNGANGSGGTNALNTTNGTSGTSGTQETQRTQKTPGTNGTQGTQKTQETHSTNGTNGTNGTGEAQTNNGADPPRTRPNGGHGLIGMRERATLLGGTFVAAAEAGTFQMRVRLPYDATRATR
jgi:signal transduction histidine kinase